MGRATKSFGRNADDEELAAVYEYLTPSRVPDPRFRGAAKQCAPVLSKGRQGLGTTNLRRPTSSAMQYRGRERGHTMCGIAGWVSYEGDANVPSETPSQQSRDNRRKGRAAPSGELDTLGHQSSTGLKRL